MSNASIRQTEARAGQASSEDRELAIALKSYEPDTEEEKRLVRKIDFILLPCLWWMYILAYLDKGNIVGLTPHTNRQCLVLTCASWNVGKRQRCWPK
jgi:hypothetical protein